MQWIKTQDVQDGDIIETPSKIPMHSPIFPGMMFPIVKHYGMILHIEGKQCLVHNVIGRRPTITPCDEVFTDRKIERVLRTGMCREKIMEKFNGCNTRPYSLALWNCEHLMVFISGSSIGFPQQNAWSLAFAVLILVVLVLIFSRKKAAN